MRLEPQRKSQQSAGEGRGFQLPALHHDQQRAQVSNAHL